MREEVWVHNISDRPGSDAPMAIHIGTEKIRPGKAAKVDSALVSQKLQKLHGTQIWIGEVLPGKLRRTSRSAEEAKARALSGGSPSMDVHEARQYLGQLSKEELLDLCDSMVPPLVFPNDPPVEVFVMRLGRALFMSRVLDPEKFFWLRRWVKRGDVYIERD